MHSPIDRSLVQGGTGQTLLYKEKATGEQVAIKLIKRPIPKVIMPNILREITVRFRPCLHPAARSNAILSLQQPDPRQAPLAPNAVQPTLLMHILGAVVVMRQSLPMLAPERVARGTIASDCT